MAAQGIGSKLHLETRLEKGGGKAQSGAEGGARSSHTKADPNPDEKSDLSSGDKPDGVWSEEVKNLAQSRGVSFQVRPESRPIGAAKTRVPGATS